MKYLILIVCFFPLLGRAQIEGQPGYQSLNLSTNPRAAALGGTTISLADKDGSQFFENPATLDSISSKNLFFHINPYFADAFVYTGAYTFQLKKVGVFSAGINYVNYGSFAMTDETGVNLGTFQAHDYTVVLGKAHSLGPITMGANLKITRSAIESYGSTALLLDIGGVFHVNKNWIVAMVFQNIGGRLSQFTDLTQPVIPFDVKIGTSFKPQYMPLRFTFTTTNLVNKNPILEPTSGRSVKTVDQLGRRVNLGAELLLSKHFQVLIGYSHKRKQELKLANTSGGAGLSYGIMLKVKRIEFRFTRAVYHAAGGSSFISLRTDLNDFKTIL